MTNTKPEAAKLPFNCNRTPRHTARRSTFLSTPVKNPFPQVGEFTQEKILFLQAAMRRAGNGVNRRHCRPLHPHGQRLLDQGLLTLHRSGHARSRHSHVEITGAGIIELRRLESKFGLAPTQAPAEPLS